MCVVSKSQEKVYVDISALEDLPSPVGIELLLLLGAVAVLIILAGCARNLGTPLHSITCRRVLIRMTPQQLPPAGRYPPPLFPVPSKHLYLMIPLLS